MGTINAERLAIETDLPVLSLQYLSSETQTNRHGICRLTFRLAGGIKEEDVTDLFQASPVQIWEQDDRENTRNPVFAGSIEEISIRADGGSYYADVKAVTASIRLDRTPRRRSFQSPGMTYREIAEQVIAGCPGASLDWQLDEDSSPGGLLVQYDETDWEFLLRLASHLNGSVLTDERRSVPAVIVGIGKKPDRYIWEDTVWGCGISPLYYTNGYWHGNRKRDYLYYILKRQENCYIGETVRLFGEDRLICDKRAEFDRGELIFYYTLGTPVLFYRQTQYHELFAGMQLTGEVAGTSGETVCLRLEIDGESGQAGYPYPWKPVTGNVFYCMPEQGTKVSLRFPDQDERNAIAVDNIRTNGDTCGGYDNPQGRIFEAVTKKTLKLFPEELSAYSSSEGKLPEISIKDAAGISLNTHKGLTVEAAGNVIIKAAAIRCTAPATIRHQAGRSSLEIHQDFNFYSPGGVENTKSATAAADMQETASRRTMTYTPCWEAGYKAIGALPMFGGSSEDMDAMGIAAAGSLPRLARRETAEAMSYALSGGPPHANPSAGAFRAIEIDTQNGGYPLPEKPKNQ